MSRPREPSWLAGHQALRKGRASIAGEIYLLTVTTFRREPLFVDFPKACCVARCFEGRLSLGENRLLAWVLMPDHAHWLLQLGEGERLETSVGRLKALSAREFNRLSGRRGSVWTSAFHDHALRNEKEVLPAARYIVANPIRAGMVRRIGDYPFWNAQWL
ncbi:REP-associated tyrosine transposase [Pseudomonas nitroreducens]|uniref:REP-associated tyrosine transposase n=1 Tax=Pseudomonas nitroreducens TaxID=46680 RepID=UPI002657ED6D|nr:transposase [Pseudomonas nitroreducens]MCP1648611.1 REP element-mobilizing transposase RayT [Pseudomonas nitroreducens]MCP1687185.1 REP element-mobilizing transposase RayT [Pseudomonas nitroreducens]